MPNPYRRALTLKVLLPLAGTAISIAIPILYSLAFNPASTYYERRIGLFVFVAPFGYALGTAAYLLYRGLALPGQLRRHGIACLRCAYSLRSLPRTGQCPECGLHYERSEIIKTWRDVIRGRR